MTLLKSQTFPTRELARAALRDWRARLSGRPFKVTRTRRRVCVYSVITVLVSR